MIRWIWLILVKFADEYKTLKHNEESVSAVLELRTNKFKKELLSHWKPIK